MNSLAISGGRWAPFRRRVLVIANETLEGPALSRAVRLRARSAEALVIAPVLTSRLRHWLSDEDEARRCAELRLAACLDRLRRRGVPARGRIGDSDPITAIADALRYFPADELVIATHPQRRSTWLERDLIGRAHRRFGLPIVHVVVDGAQLGRPTGASGTMPLTGGASRSSPGWSGAPIA